MLRKIRVVLAIASIIFVTLIFVDFTGTAHRWLGWMAKIQFLPAVLALNFGVIAALVALTLIFGRWYCSVICPLGIMQDIFAYFGKKSKKYRYTYSPAKNVLRIVLLSVMAASIAAGIGIIVALLAPYSAYGRIAQSMLQPVWIWINNLLATAAERLDSYTFYSVDVWLRGSVTLAVAIITLAALGILAWRNGRTYCNTICPVGSVLGFLSKYSLLRPVVNVSKCNSCGLCARSCKAACINSKEHNIDYSRCVACMDCIDTCRHGAISYTLRGKTAAKPDTSTDTSRRSFIVAAATAGAAAALHAQEKTVDGGLAAITEKKKPERRTPIMPPGSQSIKNLTSDCT
ncbi:MAG: 4Fe-4S binding protein, partial [Muribaculaceae bacterium]|nr:4Fe-4S binding protein [Muribaculaceae bacterium]